MQSVDAFLLSKQWRDARHGLELEIWAVDEAGPVQVLLTGQEAVMFVERNQEARGARRCPVELLTLQGVPVDALYFQSQRDLVRERARLREEGVYPAEADIKPIDRFLMERFVTGGLRIEGRQEMQTGFRRFNNPKISETTFLPELSLLSLDIETDGFDGPLLSIAGTTREEEQVFMVRPPEGPASPAHERLTFCETEREVLLEFQGWLREMDPDVIVGWNVVDFDLAFLRDLAKRLQVPFSLGRGGATAEVLEPRSRQQPRVARVPGRVVLDGIATLRSATIHFESYALEDVAQEMLGRGKRIDKSQDAAEEIRRMWRDDPLALTHYNLEDCRLVLDIFEAGRLLEFAIERQSLTGLVMDRQGGSVAAFDQLYLPRLHRAGFVAPSVGDADGQVGSPGGYVMSSKPGLYKNVIVLDFKSLYPSIIRTFLVDPLGLAQPGDDPIPGFEGATFSREKHILPALIEALWKARDAAKADQNAALSTAIKIIMNSFYGVLGTPGCRFLEHRLVSSITRRGHEVIQEARDCIEKRGLDVIYGDTDSVFVHLRDDASEEVCETQGQSLARELTEHFRMRLHDEFQIESALELEYETHYLRFLMPTIRGSEVGTKKRYAGAVRDPSGHTEIIFKGLEAVRSDWTPLARRFQRELFRRVFADEPYVDFICQTAEQLRRGALDDELTYRKRLRRDVNDYVRNIPPHVQAARKLSHPGRRIDYLMTIKGPEPLAALKSPIDYRHYLHRQLAPAAESILNFTGEDFDELTARQLRLF